MSADLEVVRLELTELEQITAPSEGDVARSDELLAEFDRLSAELDTARRAHVRATARSGGGQEGPGGPDRPRTDPALAALDATHRRAGEFVPDVAFTRAEALVRSDDPTEAGLAAQWVTATADPHYESAVRAVLLDPTFGHRNFTTEEVAAWQRAQTVQRAMTLVDSAGGFLVPFTLDPSIILTNAGSVSPVRRLARTVNIVTDTWNGVTSAGVNAEWLAEAAEAADASPTFAQPSITAHKAAAWVQGSFEVLADSGFAAEVGPLLADAKDRLEATAFATGSGSGQPKGVITAVSAVPASVVAAAVNNTYAAVDVYATQNALPARHRPRAAWAANLTIINATRQFETSGGSRTFPELSESPMMLLGWTMNEDSQMDGVIATGDDYVLLAGDWQNYVVVDRVGTTMIYEPLVMGSNRRPTGEAGWFAYFRTGGDVVNADGFRLLRV